MTAFIMLAAVLVLAAVAAIAVPLLRPAASAPGAPAPAPWTALVASATLVLGSALLYATTSSWSWRPASTGGDSPQGMVARLARKLEREPDDLNGWLMLGRSYVVLQQYQQALRAYERADRLAGGKSADALVGEAEALALANEGELEGRAGRLIEQALTLDPNSGKALFFGAVAAMHRSEWQLAHDRLTMLLAMSPAENLRPLLAQQLAIVDAKLGSGGPSNAAAPAASSGSSRVRVRVSLAPSVALPQGATPLFVLLRDPARPGPPLAVKRLEPRFPQSVELTSADAMVPGRSFEVGQQVQVVARIARSGNPVAASGDPYGEASYRVGSDGVVDILIDRVTP